MTTIETPAAGMSPLPAAGTNDEHGSLRLALGKRCPCRKCRIAKNAYQRRVRRLKAYGRWQPLVDAGPVREQVVRLHASGISYNQIAEQSGASPLTISRIARGVTKDVRPDNADAILALTAAEMHQKLLPSVGSARRLRALVAIGWPFHTIGPYIGLHPDSVARIHRQPYIYRVTADDVAVGYERLKGLTPEDHGVSPIGATKSRRLAERRGWPDPLWWEDMGHIDDPTFDPTTAEEELKRNGQGALRRAEIEHLSSYGLSNEEIADRLGLRMGTVRDIVRELRTGRRRDRQVSA